MKRAVLTFSIFQLLAVLLAGPLLAQTSPPQQGDRAVRVQRRQALDNERRVALVIGNYSYRKIAALRNPGNDARDMAAALRETGFKVTLLLNANRARMGRAVGDFEDEMARGGVGLFFFAGHGVQVGGVNYLIPIGANITRQSEVEYEAISANRVLSSMEAAGNRLNMVFLDACRNNPFKGSRFRALGGGLAAVRNAPRGSLISYATGAGNVAADGGGRNGIYTKNLLRHLRTPGLELTQMMKRVRSGVRQDTRNKQTPYELSSLTGDFFFKRAAPSRPVATLAPVATVAPAARKELPPAPAPRRMINAEETLWKTIENSRDIEDFQDYLGAFPTGRFAVIARIKIRRLKRAAKPQPATTPKVAPKAAPSPRKQSIARRSAPSSYPLSQITGRQLSIIKGASKWIWSVAFSPDGRLALSASDDYSPRVWEVPSGRWLRNFKGHTGAIKSAVFSPDGRLLLSGARDKTMRLWEVASGRLLRTLKGHSGTVRGVAFSPDGRLALSGSYDKTLRVWEVATGRHLRTLRGHVKDINAVAFSSDGRLALSGSDDKTARVWEVATGRNLRTLRGHSGKIQSVAVSPDGRLALSGSYDNTLRLWEMATGRHLRTFRGHSGGITSVAFSPDGRLALSGSKDKTLRVWEVSSARSLRTLAGHTGSVWAVAFSPDERLAMSAANDKTIRIWEIFRSGGD